MPSEGTAVLLRWYARHGRTHLPWRTTRDPYAIVVSEFMLQQTQVERVLPLYTAFLARYPDFAALAAASAGDVIVLWRGLGYNSRAVRLHALARTVVADHGGVLPRTREELLALPGIGPYTASAIRAFAFDEPDAALDTNIRRIVHRTAFGLEFPARAAERAIDTVAAERVAEAGGHDWNSAMMDLGASICTARAPKCLLCPLQPTCAAAPVDAVRLAALAKQHQKRSPQEAIPFERTTRYLRGRIVDRLRDVPAHESLSHEELARDLAAIIPRDRVDEIDGVLAALVRDGVLDATERGVALRR